MSRGVATTARGECPFCKKKFVASHLASHVAKQHTGARPVRCERPDCDEYFADERAMRRHVALFHDQTHKCATCGRAFSTKQMKERHEAFAHTTAKTIPCPIDGCDKMFKTTASIAEHIRRAHTREKPHACPFPGCTATFSSASDKNRHHRSHFREDSRGVPREINQHLSQVSSSRKRSRTTIVEELADPAAISSWLLRDDM